MPFGCFQFARRIYIHFRLLKQAFRIFMIVSRSWLFSNPVKFVSDDGGCMYVYVLDGGRTYVRWP